MGAMGYRVGPAFRRYQGMSPLATYLYFPSSRAREAMDFAALNAWALASYEREDEIMSVISATTFTLGMAT